MLEHASRRTDATFEIVDLLDYPLPHFDEPMSPATGQYQNDHTKEWAAKIASYDGYVMVTPEYNHSTSGVLKNAIDYLFAEWNNKAFGVVSYGGVGGARAAEHLRLIGGELKMADVRTNVALSLFTDFLEFTKIAPSDYQVATLDDPARRGRRLERRAGPAAPGRLTTGLVGGRPGEDDHRAGRPGGSSATCRRRRRGAGARRTRTADHEFAGDPRRLGQRPVRVGPGHHLGADALAEGRGPAGAPDGGPQIAFALFADLLEDALLHPGVPCSSSRTVIRRRGTCSFPAARMASSEGVVAGGRLEIGEGDAGQGVRRVDRRSPRGAMPTGAAGVMQGAGRPCRPRRCGRGGRGGRADDDQVGLVLGGQADQAQPGAAVGGGGSFGVGQAGLLGGLLGGGQRRVLPLPQVVLPFGVDPAGAGVSQVVDRTFATVTWPLSARAMTPDRARASSPRASGAYPVSILVAGVASRWPYRRQIGGPAGVQVR